MKPAFVRYFQIYKSYSCQIWRQDLTNLFQSTGFSPEARVYLFSRTQVTKFFTISTELIQDKKVIYYLFYRKLYLLFATFYGFEKSLLDHEKLSFSCGSSVKSELEKRRFETPVSVTLKLHILEEKMYQKY